MMALKMEYLIRFQAAGARILVKGASPGKGKNKVSTVKSFFI